MKTIVVSESLDSIVYRKLVDSFYLLLILFIVLVFCILLSLSVLFFETISSGADMTSESFVDFLSFYLSLLLGLKQ